MGGRHGAALFCVAKSDLRRASNGAVRRIAAD